MNVTEPQVWTLIGVFAAALFGTLTLMSTMFVRILRTEIGSVRSELKGEVGSLRSELQRVEGVLSAQIAHLDRDVSALSRHVFGAGPDA